MVEPHTIQDGESENAEFFSLFLQCKNYASYAAIVAASASWNTTTDMGRWSKDTSTGNCYIWNGSALQQVPVTGGAGAPITCSFVTMNEESSLSAETRHVDIPRSAAHPPPLHATDHQNGGADPINVTGLPGLLADEQDAGTIKGYVVNADGYGLGRFLAVNIAGEIAFAEVVPGVGDMTKANFATTSDTKVDTSINSEKFGGSLPSAFALSVHAPTHATLGSDPFLVSHLLDAVARLKVRKNTGGADVGARRRLNLIEGAGVTLTVADDAANEEVDVTITNSGTVAGEWVQVSGTSPIVYAHGKGYTPKAIANPDAVQPYSWATHCDATNITIYHSAVGSLTFNMFLSSS